MSNKCDHCREQTSVISVFSKDNTMSNLCNDCYEYSMSYNKALDDIKKLAKPSSNYIVIHKDKIEELRK